MTSDARSWDRLRDEAADWLAAMDTGQVSREQFEEWRDADPRHAAAFVQVANTFVTIDRLKPDLKARVAPVRTLSRRNLFIGGAAALSGVAGVATYAVATAKEAVRTDVGQRKSLRLPSGALLQVNTASKIEYRLRTGVTDVWLKKGELALDLSRNHGKCRLYGAGREVDVSGATVNARLRGNLMDLAVVAGACTVRTDGNGQGSDVASTPIVVLANHAVLSGQNESVVRPLNDMDTAFLMAWPHGELLLQGQTLDTAVAEYNRYLTHKIVIADASLASVRIGGRFTTRDPAAFLTALRESFDIRATDDGQGNIALTK